MILSLSVILLGSLSLFASDLEIKNVRYFSEQDTKGDLFVVFDLSWKNSWRNSRNHDAAWVFVKQSFGPNGYRHARLAADGHSFVNQGTRPGGRFDLPGDRSGVFISPARNYRGDMNLRVRLRLETEGLRDNFRPVFPQVFGIEMVYVPQGPFSLGEPGTKALDYGAFYRSGADGNPDGLIRVTSENAIPVGNASGALNYKKGEYVGDALGPIPASFPKGFKPFYVMKYEMTQGQYTALLNIVTDRDSYKRANFNGRSYYQNKGTIRLEGDRFVAGKPDRPMNFVTWDDSLAFADWAALRPMTEFEFTKASRGPGRPVQNEYPWGTGSTNRLARIVDVNNDLVQTNGWAEERLSNQTRPVFGASFYWVMDLSGSVWERVITIGSPDGRAFQGTNGDGRLRQGFATNEDWPHTHKGKAGHGYRGGGFYTQGRAEHEFNPYSPIAYRRFGGWSGEYPHLAYGFRAARSIE